MDPLAPISSRPLSTVDQAPRGWLASRFELSRHGSAANVRSMEGLRGLAVFLVFLVHYVATLKPWIAPGGALYTVTEAVYTAGNIGVDLFFVLSGYLIYGSLMTRPQRFVPFMARRLQRIYPAFLAVFGLYIVLSFAVPSFSKLPSSWTAAASYLFANLLLLPGLLPIRPLITVAWSLSYEMFYYLAVPLLIAAFGLRRRRRSWRVALCLGLGIGIGVVCALHGGPVRLVMFIAGMLLHEALAEPTLPPPGGAVALAALAAGLGATLVLTRGPAGESAQAAVLSVAFFLLCHECFSRPRSRIAQGFSWTPLRWLGNMSYSYYLLHGLALKAVFLVLARLTPMEALEGWQFWTLLPPMFALSLLPAAVLFLAVERPLSLAPRRARVGRPLVDIGSAVSQSAGQARESG